jgi:hypothetical protein
MPLIPEDGTGLADADSYNSLVELNAYASSMGEATFSALGDSAKEVAARKAAVYLDGAYEGRLTGRRLSSTQARAFPRFDCEDRDGNLLPSDEVHPAWKEAHCALTVKASASELAPDLKRGGAVKRVKVGPIEKEFQDTASGSTLRPSISLILNRLLQPANVWRQT